MATPVTRKRDSLYLKLIALLSTVRWKNVLFTAIAQYIAFLFAFHTKDELWMSLGLYKVHMIILSTAFMLAAGYIINNFYDVEKDMVNRPHRTNFQNLVSRGFKLNLYVLLNAIGLTIAFLASFNIFLFFLGYGFLLWFYSHKLSKLVLIRELSASFLTVLAFFSLVLYFQTITLPFFLYGMSMFFMLFAREIHKGIIWFKGDMIHGYKSIATQLGIEPSKRLFQAVLSFSLAVDAVFLWLTPRTELYIVLGIIALLKIVLVLLVNKQHKWMHRIIQLIILTYVIGVVWL